MIEKFPDVAWHVDWNKLVEGSGRQAAAKERSRGSCSRGDQNEEAALREALEGGAGPTRVLSAATPRRSVLPLVAGLVIAAILAGAGLAALLTRDDGQASAQDTTAPKTAPAPQPPPPPPPPLPPPPPPPPLPPPPPPAVDATGLTDQATQALENGDYAQAEQLARQAVAALQGSGELYEAYAEYDLGAALVGLGRCDEAVPHLERSEAIQGKRREISRAIKTCQKGHGKGKGDKDD